MSALGAALEDYLALRRSLGFKLTAPVGCSLSSSPIATRPVRMP